MLERMNNIGSICLGFGITLLFAHVFDVISLPYVYIPLIVAGLSLMVIPALQTKLHRSPLCRAGLHKFVHIGWDNDIKHLAIYECERCKKRKKVVRSMSG